MFNIRIPQPFLLGLEFIVFTFLHCLIHCSFSKATTLTLILTLLLSKFTDTIPVSIFPSLPKYCRAT